MSDDSCDMMQHKTAPKRLTKGELAKQYILYRKMITAIQSKPCLYDDEDAEYTNEKAVQRAWLQVMNECPIKDNNGNVLDVDGLKQKWVAFKKNFSKERAKRRKNGTSQGGWPLYDTMLFMDKHILVRRTHKSQSIAAASIKVEEFDTMNEQDTVFVNEPAVDQTHVSHLNTVTADVESSFIEKPISFHSSDNHDDGEQSSLNENNVKDEVLPSANEKAKQSNLVVVDLHADNAGNQIKKIALKHSKKVRNDRLDEAKSKAQEEMRRVMELENEIKTCDEINENTRPANEEERKINKTFSDFVVASLDKIKDDKERRVLLKDIMNILYEE